MTKKTKVCHLEPGGPKSLNRSLLIRKAAKLPPRVVAYMLPFSLCLLNRNNAGPNRPTSFPQQHQQSLIPADRQNKPANIVADAMLRKDLGWW